MARPHWLQNVAGRRQFLVVDFDAIVTLKSTATIVCFMMLEPELFSAVARSAMPLRQFGTLYLADLTDNFYSSRATFLK